MLLIFGASPFFSPALKKTSTQNLELLDIPPDLRDRVADESIPSNLSCFRYTWPNANEANRTRGPRRNEMRHFF